MGLLRVREISEHGLSVDLKQWLFNPFIYFSLYFPASFLDTEHFKWTAYDVRCRLLKQPLRVCTCYIELSKTIYYSLINLCNVELLSTTSRSRLFIKTVRYFQRGHSYVERDGEYNYTYILCTFP